MLVLLLCATAGLWADRFGYSLARFIDFDGDKIPEIVVTNPAGPIQGRGEVWLLSGATGAPLRCYAGPKRDCGFNVVVLGDLDNDGMPDLGIGGQLWRAPSQVVSTRTWRAIINIEEGGMVHRMRDIDGDARPDFVMGDTVFSARTLKPIRFTAPPHEIVPIIGADEALTLSRVNHLRFYGSDGPPLMKEVGGAIALRLGTPDQSWRLVVLSRSPSDAGYEALSCYTVPGNSALFSSKVSHYDSEPRATLASIGDVDSDGYCDFVVSDHRLLDIRLSVRSGESGVELAVLRSEWKQKHVMTACGLGDINCDGFPDFVVGEYGYGPKGCIRAVSGKDFSELYRVLRPEDL